MCDACALYLREKCVCVCVCERERERVRVCACVEIKERLIRRVSHICNIQ